MNEWRDLGDVFLSSFRKMKRPALLLPALVAFAVPQTLAIGLAGHVVNLRNAGSAEALAKWTNEYSALAGLIGLAVALMVPAVISGMATVAGAAVDRDGGDWSAFRSGTGTYYWRIIGASILFSLARALLGQGLFGQVGRAVASYFYALWMASAVLDGVGAVAAIGNGARFAWKNPGLFLPAYILDQAGGYLIQLFTGAFFSVSSVQTIVTVKMEPGWFLAGILGGAAEGYLFMFFMLVYFTIYRMLKAPDDRPVEPPAPPLDPDQHTEQ